MFNRSACVRCGGDPHPGPVRDPFHPYSITCPRYEPPAGPLLRLKVAAVALLTRLLGPVGRA